MKLSLCQQTDIQTECWSYYRVSIIQSDERFRNWIVDHYDQIFMVIYPTNMFCRYGSGYMIDQYSYYNDALISNKLTLTDMDEFIHIVKSKIENKMYVLIDCDYNISSSAADSKISIHELFIIGYESDFFICMVSRNGLWSEVKLNCSEVLLAYNKAVSFIKDSGNSLQWRKMFSYPFMTFHLNSADDYIPTLYRFWSTLLNTLAAPNSERILTNTFDECNGDVYIGIIAICEALIYRITSGQYIPSLADLPAIFNKMCEYSSLMKKRMQLISQLYSIDIVADNISKCDELIHLFTIVCNISLKDRYTNKISREKIAFYLVKIVGIQKSLYEYLCTYVEKLL